MANASTIYNSAHAQDPTGAAPSAAPDSNQGDSKEQKIGVAPESFTMDQWKSIIPEEFQGIQEVKDAKTPKDLMNNFAYYRSKFGSAINIPGEDASDDDRATFLNKLRTQVPQLLDMPGADDAEGLANLYQRLGRPDDRDGYEAPSFELEEGVSMNDKEIDLFKDIALKHNLTKSQFQGVLQDYLGGGLEAANAGQVKFNKDMTKLKDEWGEAYGYKVSQAGAIAKEFFPNTGLPGMIEAGTVGAGALRDLTALANQLGSEGQQLVGHQGDAGVSTPQELRDQAQELMTKIVDMQPGDARQRAIEKRVKLLQAANRNG